MNSLPQILHTISYMALPLLLAMVLHEYAHGWVAFRCGDPTARLQGRLTLNPLAHIDPFGTIKICRSTALLYPGASFSAGPSRFRSTLLSFVTQVATWLSWPQPDPA